MPEEHGPPTDMWDPLTYAEGPLPSLSMRRSAPRRAALSVSAIAVAVDEVPPRVPLPRIRGAWRHETEQVLTGGRRPASGYADFAVLAAAYEEASGEASSATSGATSDGTDVAARALRGLGPVNPPEPFYLVRTGPGPDPYVAMLPSLVHEFPWLGDDLGITPLDELGGLTLFGLLSWSVPSGSGATALVTDRSASAVALRARRGDGPVRVASWGEGAPPVTVLARVAAVFGGPGPCDAWLALHDALRSRSVGDGDRVLLRAGCAGREAWAQLEINDRDRLRLGEGAAT